MSLSGKVVLVTGGAGGIGIALVKKLLESNAKGVAIVDISRSNTLEEISQIYGKKRVIFIKTDVTQEKELTAAFDKTVEIFKNLDIVINNAGIVNEVDWEKSLNVLLVAAIRGTYLALLNYLPKYKSGSEGIIVNTASILGLDPDSMAPMYCLSKRALISLSETLGTDDFYKTYKTKVLTICPGVVKTEMVVVKEKTLFMAKEEVDERMSKLNKVFQTPEFVAEKYIDIINKAQNGSIWVVEEEEPEYEVKFPGRKNMRI